jgi:hypothetical protein
MYLEVVVANTDIRLVNWLKQAFGGSIYAGNTNTVVKKLRTKLCYHWYLGSKQAADVLAGALPYFLIKREQAEIGLAFQRTILVDHRYGCKGRPAALLQEQYAMREQLSVLKGTTHRVRRTADGTTLQ